MTIGLFVPLVAAIGDLWLVMIALRGLRALPGPTDIGYDQALVRQRQMPFQVTIAASIAAPVLLYVVLNFVMPEIGAIEIF
jgi:hypothetical protein